MVRRSVFLALSLALHSAGEAAEEERQYLQDIQGLSPVKLSAAELKQLMLGAKVGRVSAGGIAQSWVNNPDGTLWISSVNNRGRSFTEPGTWKITEKDEFCLEIEWHGSRPERWCRPILKATNAYYTVDKNNRVRKLDIQK